MIKFNHNFLKKLNQKLIITLILININIKLNHTLTLSQKKILI